MAEGVPTNNQRGRRSGPCRLWGGLDRARHIVPTALLVRVQCFRKSLHKAVQGPSTRPIVVSMINGSYCRRRRRLTIFEPDEMKWRSQCLKFHFYLHNKVSWISIGDEYECSKSSPITVWLVRNSFEHFNSVCNFYTCLKYRHTDREPLHNLWN